MAQRVEEHLVEGDAIEERHGEPEALSVAGSRHAPLKQSYHVRALDHGHDPHLVCGSFDMSMLDPI